MIFNSSFTNLLMILKQFVRFTGGYLYFLVIPLVIRNISDFSKLMTVFLLNTIFPVLQFIFGLHSFSEIEYYELGKISDMSTGLYSNTGQMGITAITGIIASLFKAIYHYNKLKIFLYLVLAIFFAAIAFFSLSRTLFIAVSILIFIFFLTSIRFNRYVSFLLLTLTIIILLTSLPLYFKPVQGIILRSQLEFEVLRGERETSYAMHGRVGRIQGKSETFFEKPFFEKMLGPMVFLGPHGDFFNFLFFYGIIVLSLYIWFFSYLLLKVLRLTLKLTSNFDKQLGYLVLGSLVAWIVIGVSMNVFFLPDYSYIILGNAALFIQYTRNRFKSFNGDKNNRISQVYQLNTSSH